MGLRATALLAGFGAICLAAVVALVLGTGLSDNKLVCRFGPADVIGPIVE